MPKSDFFQSLTTSRNFWAGRFMRFTLAACLALMAFAGVLCFLLTTQASVASYFLLIVITILAPVCAVAGIVYGRDNLRAFCIGAALPLALLVWTSVPHLQDIRFDPDAYGWSPPGRVPRSRPADEDPFGAENSLEVVPAGPALSEAHEMTLHRVKLMKTPTCSLSVIAVVCGVVVMAIRGGLQRKETAPNQLPGTISS